MLIGKYQVLGGRLREGRLHPGSVEAELVSKLA